MGMRPNALIILALTPEGNSNETIKAIASENPVVGIDPPYYIDIEGDGYIMFIFEDHWDKSDGIESKVGDIIIYDSITHTNGDFITWNNVEKRKNNLEKFGEKTCQNHNCKMEIRIGASYD